MRRERPVLLVGAGVIAAGAHRRAAPPRREGVDPVAATLLGLGALPHDHPLFLGMVGMHAARCTNLVLEECDLLVALGIRFDDRATGKAAEFCPRAKILHVDIDPSELGKIKQPMLGHRGRRRRGAARARAARRGDSRVAQWMRRVDDAARRASARDARRRRSAATRTASSATPRRLLPDDAIVTTDVGQHQMWVAQAFPFTRPRQWLTSGGLGTMGFGLPAAIGAALARARAHGRLLHRRRQPAHEPAGARHRRRGGRERQDRPAQQRAPRARAPAAAALLRRPLPRVALPRRARLRRHRARLRRRAVDLGQAENPAAAIAEALRQPGPCLVNVPIAGDENVYPMVPPGGANRDMITGERCDYEQTGANNS